VGALWEEVVKQLEEEFATIGVNCSETWPGRIATRFEAIGESISYYTAYTRLSSRTHTDAEDTISLIYFKALGDEQLLMQMALETLAFSEYLVHYGAEFYLRALLLYTAVFGDSTAEEIGEDIGVIVTQMEAIGTEWGW
jgi:hypothetical protein